MIFLMLEEVSFFFVKVVKFGKFEFGIIGYLYVIMRRFIEWS